MPQHKHLNWNGIPQKSDKFGYHLMRVYDERQPAFPFWYEVWEWEPERELQWRRPNFTSCAYGYMPQHVPKWVEYVKPLDAAALAG